LAGGGPRGEEEEEEEEEGEEGGGGHRGERVARWQRRVQRRTGQGGTA